MNHAQTSSPSDKADSLEKRSGKAKPHIAFRPIPDAPIVLDFNLEHTLKREAEDNGQKEVGNKPVNVDA